MKKEKPTNAVCFNGILVADDWDENGKVVGVAIYTDRDKIYRCKRNELFDDLLNFIQMRVSVDATKAQQLNGKILIDVSNVEKLEDDIDDD